MSGPTPLHRARLIAVAVLVLTVGWLLTPALSGPPLYDGLGFPDEPYRYIQAPAGYQHTAAATSARQDFPITAKAYLVLDAASDETGPQVEVEMQQSAVTVKAGDTVYVSAVPSAPRVQPADGEVWGNVYTVGVRVNGTAAVVNTGAGPNVIRLRAPAGPPPTPGMEMLVHGAWHRVPTTRIGNDVYSAPLNAVGSYALVVPRGQARAPTATANPTVSSPGPASSSVVGADTKNANAGHSNSLVIVLIIIATALLVLVVVATGVRLSRRST